MDQFHLLPETVLFVTLSVTVRTVLGVAHTLLSLLQHSTREESLLGYGWGVSNEKRVPHAGLSASVADAVSVVRESDDDDPEEIDTFAVVVVDVLLVAAVAVLVTTTLLLSDVVDVSFGLRQTHSLWFLTNLELKSSPCTSQCHAGYPGI